MLEIDRVQTGGALLEFFRIASADFADDRSLILADAGLFSLVMVPPEGDPFAIELRKGEGPGEGQAVSRAGSLVGDTVFWVDPILQRVNFVRTSSGEMLDPISASFDPERGLPEVIGSLDGSNLLFLQWKAPVFSGSAYVARGEARMYCSEADGTRGPDMEVEGSEQLVVPEGAGHSTNRIPYASRPVLASWNDRILYSDSRNLSIRILGCGGETIREFALPGEASLGQDRTREALDAWLAEQSAGAASRMGRFFEAYEALVTGPGAAHGRILTDPESGRLWIQSATGDRWIVTDSIGQTWTPVLVPEGLTPLTVRANHAVFLAIDTLGVHRIEVRELKRPVEH